jgi:putative methionine-R-sulfoxide reductase with GAF domain
MERVKPKARKPRTRLEAMKLLPEVIRRLLAVSDAEVLLREVCSLAKDALGADEAALLLVDPAGRDLVEHEVVGKKLRPTRMRLRIREEGIVGWVASHRLPQVVPDVRKDRRYVKVSSETRSEAAVPILSGDEVLGVLNFDSRRLGYFHRSDLPLLEFLASQLAIALTMVQREEEIETWKERVGALHNLLRLGGGVAPVSTMMQRVADAVRMTCGGHYAAVYQGDYEHEELVLLAHSSAYPLNIAVGARMKFRTGLVGKAFELGETVNVKDVRRDPMYVARVPGVMSEVCVPIRVGDNCLGILDAQAQTVGEFTGDEAMFLEAVARILAPSFRVPASPARA